eukprot:Clim_evm6s109 gene=Clim_evmTU6s109
MIFTPAFRLARGPVMMRAAFIATPARQQSPIIRHRLRTIPFGTRGFRSTAVARTPLNSPFVANAVAEYGEIVAAGLSGYNPACAVRHLLEFTSATTGMEYSWTIIAVVLAFRTLMSPLQIWTQKKVAKLTEFRTEIEEFKTRINEAQTEKDKMTAMMDLQKFQQEKGISFFDGLYGPLIQAPVLMSFFFGIRGMSNEELPSLKDTSFLTCPDLTMADPTYLMPIMSTTALWLTMELGVEMGGGAQQAAGTKNIIRGLMLMGLYITTSLSGAVNLYLLTNAGFGMVFSALLYQPAIRRALGLPPLLKSASGTNQKESFSKAFNETVQTYQARSDAVRRKRDKENVREYFNKRR